MSARRGPRTLDLTLGQPARPPDEDLVERAFDAFREGPPGYTENAGLLALREAIAAHHGRAGPEEVIVTVGSEQAVYLALTAALAPGDEVLVPDPGYPAYPGIVKLLGAVPVGYPVSREAGLVPRVEDLLARATPRTRAVVWNTPSNPFGRMPGPGESARLAAEARARGWVVVSDEIYRDLRYDGAPFSSPADHDREVLLVSGLSKSCALTGFRLGYLLGSPSFVRQATLAHQLMVTCAPRPSQLLALEIFREPARLGAHLPGYAATRRALARAAPEALPEGARLHLGDGAFYAVLDVEPWLSGSPGRRTLDLALRLLDEVDVAVVPGVAFGPSGDWFLRLSFAGDADAAEAGLRRIGEFLSPD
jgi:aspartate/methionine/tyrosine aminotransferase